MRETELTYYFSHMEEFPLPRLFNNCTHPFEVLARVKPFLNELLPTDGQTILGERCEGVVISGPVFVGRGTVLHPGVVIEGPAWIGEDCELMAGAYVRPYTILGNKCVVGHGCEVKHSVVQNGAKVQSFTFIGDCMIGKSARVGSGTILANRKFNQSNVGIKINGVYIDLGTDFFGCVLGDNSRIGANSTTLPGTHIGPYSWVLPATRVKGFVPEKTRIIAKEEYDVTENEALDLK